MVGARDTCPSNRAAGEKQTAVGAIAARSQGDCPTRPVAGKAIGRRAKRSAPERPSISCSNPLLICASFLAVCDLIQAFLPGELLQDTCQRDLRSARDAGRPEHRSSARGVKTESAGITRPAPSVGARPPQEGAHPRGV